MPNPRAYFDTSAVIKRYVNVGGSSQARDLMRTCRCLSSKIMPLEALSAVCRRRALGQISDSAFARISSLLKIDRERWDLLVVDNSVLHRAEAVLRDYGVKTLDAIYIASALLFQSGVGSRIAFISGDERQLSAAAACDLSVRPLRN